MTSNLSTHLRDQRRPRKGPPCSISLIVAALGDDDRRALLDALDDPSVSSSTIWRALRANGIEVALTTIQRHRRKECLCDSLR